MMRAVALALALATGACGQNPAKTAVDAVAPQPSPAARATFAHCAWGEVRGQTISMWSFTCPAGAGSVRLVADDVLPGFLTESTDPARPGRTVVVRLFDKAPDAPIEAVLEVVRALSPGMNTPTCVLAPAEGVDHVGKDHYVLAPTGAAKTEYEKQVVSDTVPTPPCGSLGVSADGDRFFMVAPGRPDKVMFVDRGSEIQIFDETTLRVHDAP
jgi:hypothetical protein